MRFVHENLEIWQLAIELSSRIYKLTEKFPSEEKFGLTAQSRRAVVSIALDIAEGSGRHSKKDFSNFLNRAITSLQETDTCLKIAIRLNYITEQDYQIIAPLIEKLYFKLIAFNKKVRNEIAK